MSTPTVVLPGPACSTAPSEPRVSASTQDAPPCRTPAGCVLPATGIVPTTRPADASTSVIPIRSTSVFRMGITLVEASDGRVVGTMPVAGNTQPAGVLHGGASCVLAETLGSLGAVLHAGPGKTTVGV